MADILQKYGIKEVADITFYNLRSGAPELFIDTAKVSTLEQTAEQSEARGGKGNPPLIIWDYGKEINVTIEDALFSAKSMQLMFGGAKGTIGSETLMTKTVYVDMSADITSGNVYNWKDEATGASASITVAVATDSTKLPTMSTNIGYLTDENGVVYTSDSTNLPTSGKYFLTFAVARAGSKITIDAKNFPGTYKVVGDTYARSQDTGEDEFFMFVINQAKMSAENTITLEAEGDPSVFNLNLRVLRPANKPMMELIKYDVSNG